MDKKISDKKLPETQSAKKRTLSGVVTSDAMDKTVVVKVMRVKVHSRYQKRVFTGKKYKAHDEQNAFKAGDSVRIVECRPISRDKRWRVVYPARADRR